MHQQLIVELASVVGLGVLATWIAWRFRLPSILMLLVFGFVAGPIVGWIQPDRLLGALTFPVVSLAAAIILFEGGLSASFREIRSVAGPVRRLVTIGLVFTWMAISAAAARLLGFSQELALLLGAILVVTGPTVIGPLLLHVRPRGPVGSIAKLEGIINDPIGAIVAVLVYEVVVADQPGSAVGVVLAVVLTSVVVATITGLAGAALVIALLRKRMLPAFLANSVTIAIVLVVFAASNVIQAESGLLAVTLLGIALASQRVVDMRSIVHFNEHMRVVLISVLFIVLAARIELSAFAALPLGVLGFLAAVLVIRVLMVQLSLLGTSLGWRERLWLCGMAPRGVVAAAVASIFGLRLSQLGYEKAELLMPVVFLVIVSTVIVYGLGSRPLAAVLGLRSGGAHGVLVLGAGPVARALAVGLDRAGVRALLVDPDWGNVAAARQEGLEAEHGLIASERLLDRLDLEGIGHLLAVSRDDQANALAVAQFRDVFEDRVYQLSADHGSVSRTYRWAPPRHMRGRTIGGDLTQREVARMIGEGAACKVTRLTEEFDLAAFRKHHGRKAHPLFVVTPSGKLEVFDARESDPPPGARIVSLVEEAEEVREPRAATSDTPAAARWQEQDGLS